LKKIWYAFFKLYIQTGLFFYTKKIKIVGKENIPKKRAILFAVNHPKGLLDPLLVTTNTPRITHYLVRAAIFKKPVVKKFLGTLNLMPIYRIRDGVKELSKNTEVFNDCYDILNKQRALMIFPEGSHDRRRTIRPISKGFTRILFGAFNKYPNLKIHVIPVGVTYQNSSQFPCKVAIHYGSPILANELYNPKEVNKSVNAIKEAVSNQLKKITVHIPLDENYNKILQNLNNHNIDFTNVAATNQMIQSGKVKVHASGYNYRKIFKVPFILNSIFPWIFWKIFSKKIDEIEFIDTFRFGIGICVFPVSYLLQSIIVSHFYGITIAGIYFFATLITALIYCKSAATPTA